MLIAPIETTYDGIRFRSRTEARWAVFFDIAGIRYEYEKEGYVLPSGPYLPDFWLPDLNMWLEVKGIEPTPEEVEKCRELANATSAKLVLLAIGPPRAEEQIIPFNGLPVEANGWDGNDDWYTQEWPCREVRLYFADDRRNEGEFWLVSDDCGCTSIGPITGPDHGKYPCVHSAAANGYEAARAARFDSPNAGRKSLKREPVVTTMKPSAY
jgi:hypothetical protein